ncbi:hypothetical protein [uncultured Piscinibacter sp.]|uniref:hypothetical protein n=1 Tax=uncultured Piscinibacter sp. TaxID=1131835 RepID=UPI002636AB50|nr:hypothetical protein [uncultured Piscinibacter sp.]
MTIRHWAPLALISFAGAACAAGPSGKPGHTPPQVAGAAPTAAAPSSSAGATRDWKRIDTNQDNYISPEEMEKYLAENPGPLRK